MKNITLHELQLLTGTNYQALKKLLAPVPFTHGPNRAHVYNSAIALCAIYTAPSTTLEQAKLRSELLNAKLKELTLAQKTKDSYPKSFVFDLINSFILHWREKTYELRRKKLVDQAWENACGDAWESIARACARRWQITLPADEQQDSAGPSQSAPNPRQFQKRLPRSGKQSKGQNFSHRV